MWRAIASNFLTLLLLLLLAAAVLVAWGRQQYTGPGPSAAAQCVVVAPGVSMQTVAAELAEQDAISSRYIFLTGAAYSGKAGQQKFGSFLVPPHASMEHIVNVITAGGPSTCGTEVTFRIGVRGNTVVLRDMDRDAGRYAEVAKYDPATEDAPDAITDATAKPDARLRIAVAEGVTSWQIVEGLKLADFLDGDLEEVPEEGTLAPETFDVKAGSERAALLARMAELQEVNLARAWENRADDLPYDSPEEALIMASIVEKETSVADERPVVASVFVNRLRQGMRLETDPTVIYGVTLGKSILERGLRRSELQQVTPYNTYRVDGLPPTPIANPGRAAIEATLQPADTDYLFFVADGTGGHAFSRTLAEHEENVARWREIEAAGGPTGLAPGESAGQAGPVDLEDTSD